MLEVQLHQAVDEVSPHVIFGPVDVAVPPSGTAPVVNAGEFDPGLGQSLVTGVATRADTEADAERALWIGQLSMFSIMKQLGQRAH